MAPKKSGKNKIVAKLVTGKKVPCSFCNREVDDELLYGKLYAIGDIQCHYFCVLLSSCLIQKGKDGDGLFGFLYEDILTEIERAKKHRCSYCSHGGANLGCSVSQCRKQFHLPCGKQRNSVSLFFGNYKTFCQAHAPKQAIPPTIMAKAKERKYDGRFKKKQTNFKDLKELFVSAGEDCPDQTDAQSVCVICYEAVDGYPTVNTFWPPCCARDAWFHRTCLQRMALSAGLHYLKCPLCNDKENFYQAVVAQGYYVPDRDAAWELEQNAFAEIYEREVTCSAGDCQCPMGRDHDADAGAWCIKLCLLCGSSGMHAACLPPAAPPASPPAAPPAPHVCRVCQPAAPAQLLQLASSIEAVIIQEQAQSTTRRRGPVMPSRMSLRRTKRHIAYQGASCSSSSHTSSNKTGASTDTEISRRLLSLRKPKKPLGSNPEESRSDTEDIVSSPSKIDFKTQSPAKILEERLRSKTSSDEVNEELVEELRRRFRKPKPLSEKRKIVTDILNGVFDNLMKETKQKDGVKQWCSPKKCDVEEDVVIVEVTHPTIILLDSPVKTIKEDAELTTTPLKSSNTNIEANYPMFNSPKKLKTVDILKDSSLEISAKDEVINIDVIKIDNSEPNELWKNLALKNPDMSQKCSFKFSPNNKEVLNTENIDIDMETFKDQYLNEVGLQRVKNVDKENTDKNKNKGKRKRKTKDKLVLKYEAKKRKKKRKNISIKNKNIQVKINLWNERFKLKITDAKKKKSKKYKQYILKYSENNPNLCKPKYDVMPKKRKYTKQEKSLDNLVQTSIQKFFKVKSPEATDH